MPAREQTKLAKLSATCQKLKKKTVRVLRVNEGKLTSWNAFINNSSAL